MTYRVVISKPNKQFPLKGLNELLSSMYWNPRLKKFQNEVKAENDKQCRIAIQKYLRGVVIDKPIVCHFHVYAKNKMHDRGNINSALEKSFMDALQQKKIIKNDTFNLVYDSTFFTELCWDNPRIEVEIEVIE